MPKKVEKAEEQPKKKTKKDLNFSYESVDSDLREINEPLGRC